MTQYGWKDGVFFVNSAAHMGRGELEDRGWPIAGNGSVSADQLRAVLGTAEPVVLGTYAIRVAVQDLYQPRGELLSKAQANVIVNGTILAQASIALGVPWVKAAWLEAFARQMPAMVQSAHAEAGSKGGRPSYR
jgi:hypothetical protein